MARERIKDTINFLEHFQFDSLLDYKKLITKFKEFSDSLSSLPEEDKDIILKSFCNIFERIRLYFYEEKQYDYGCLEEDIDWDNEKTYMVYKMNMPFSYLKEETKTLLPIRLLLPENTYCHPNLEIEDYKKGQQKEERGQEE